MIQPARGGPAGTLPWERLVVSHHNVQAPTRLVFGAPGVAALLKCLRVDVCADVCLLCKCLCVSACVQVESVHVCVSALYLYPCVSVGMCSCL